jgi:hypothetical protein
MERCARIHLLINSFEFGPVESEEISFCSLVKAKRALWDGIVNALCLIHRDFLIHCPDLDFQKT